MQMTEVSLSDLEADRSYVRTNKGRWLKFGNGFGNYWHTVLLPNYSTYFQDGETLVEITTERPKLMVGDAFKLEKPVPRNFGPRHPIIFKVERNGFPFRVKLNEYRITIPFHYESTDARVGIADSQWTSPAGRLMRHLNNQPLRIEWDGTKPVLYVGHKMTVPNQ